MHAHREPRIDERLDADTAICAVGAIALWGVLLVLFLLVSPI
jgi:hypothetical protein